MFSTSSLTVGSCVPSRLVLSGTSLSHLWALRSRTSPRRTSQEVTPSSPSPFSTSLPSPCSGVPLRQYLLFSCIRTQMLTLMQMGVPRRVLPPPCPTQIDCPRKRHQLVLELPALLLRTPNCRQDWPSHLAHLLRHAPSRIRLCILRHPRDQGSDP